VAAARPAPPQASGVAPIPSELRTEDLYGVEIVRAGGPYHGIGSPPQGDYVRREQLEAAAASFAALRGEVNAPVKLGHDDDQPALRSAGFGEDGQPAAGWLDNLRVVGDSLVADLRRVPRVVADLVRAGAYRARSIEFVRGYRDRRGQAHPFVITGLALLGAHQPAVSGLTDLVSLYRGELDDAPAITAYSDQADAAGAYAIDEPLDGRFRVADDWLPVAPMERTWNERQALGRVRELAGGDGSDEASASLLRRAYLWWDAQATGPRSFRWPIADVIDGQLQAVPAALFAAAGALAGDDHGLDDVELAQARDEVGFYYRRLDRVPPWGGRPAGSPAMAPTAEFSAAPAATQESPAEAAGDQADPAPAGEATNEQEAQMPEVTPELREALGVGEDADLDAIVARARELATPAPAEDPATGLRASDGASEKDELMDEVRKLSAKVEALEAVAGKGVEASKELFAAKRDASIREAIRLGKIAPSQKDEWTSHYDSAPQMVESMLASMAPNEALAAGEVGEDEQDEAASSADVDAVRALVPAGVDPTLDRTEG
jgi:hypothetical protein